MESHRRPYGKRRTRLASLPFTPQPPTYKGRASPLPFSILCRCREPPPPVKPPLPSANVDAKATRSTAGLPRARRYYPIHVLALFCLATSSPTCLFSLQFATAVDVQLWSLPGRRVPLQTTHGEPLRLPVLSDLALAPWEAVVQGPVAPAMAPPASPSSPASHRPVFTLRRWI